MTYQQSFWPTARATGRISEADLNRAVSRYIKQFRSARNDLRSTYSVFVNVEQVLPSDCDQLTLSIKTVQLSISKFTRLLNSSSQLPEKIIPKRYQILFDLHQANDLSEQSFPLIRSFRRICLEPSSRDFQHIYEQVSGLLDELLQASENIDGAYESLIG